ncbi:MAG: 7-cyano-7-deazaguanine synthase QueC [Actinomycetia bacterium]|nr:7-cyano-7-deazaguanine synthase QueC [Actinomycetes bacterium]
MSESTAAAASAPGPRGAGATGAGGGPAPTHCLLLSGGLDSTTLAAWIAAHHPGEPVEAYTFLYGQKHAVEVDSAKAVAAAFKLQHHIVELAPIHGSALTDDGIPLPEGRDLAGPSGVAPSYVPARNLLFLAQMAALRDACGPAVLWLGVHHDDHAGYPDCRPEFIEAADRAVRLGTRYGLQVRAPFVYWSKTDIVRWGLRHEVPYGLTHSCYQGRRPACGVCDTCQARLQAFAAAGAVDPIPYETGAGAGGAGTAVGGGTGL